MSQSRTEIVRTNVRNLIARDPEYNATSFSKEVLKKGKDFLNDFLTVKDGVAKKNDIGATELLAICERYGVAAVDIGQHVFSDAELETRISLIGKWRDLLRFDIKPEEVKFTRPLVSSFDPDDHDDGAGVGETRLKIVGDAEGSPPEWPSDAISELVSVAGLGDGQDVELEYVRDGDGQRQVDAIRTDYWRFPNSFLRRDLNRAASQLMVVECEGDSMEPTLTSGARVVVDVQHKRPSPDGLYAIRDRFGHIRIKRLQVALSGEPRVTILCDNPSHAPETVALDEINIIGRVVGAIRTF